MLFIFFFFFFFSSRRRHTRLVSDWSSDVCSSDLVVGACPPQRHRPGRAGGDCAPDGTRDRAAGEPSRERSEERRVGKECRAWWAAEHERKKRGRESR